MRIHPDRIADPRTMRRFARLLQPTGAQHQTIAARRWRGRHAYLVAGGRGRGHRVGRRPRRGASTMAGAPRGAAHRLAPAAKAVRPLNGLPAARRRLPSARLRPAYSSSGSTARPGTCSRRGRGRAACRRWRALMERGTWGRLRSTVPALTLPAWSSFMTGKNPGGHGVYAFRRMAFDATSRPASPTPPTCGAPDLGRRGARRAARRRHQRAAVVSAAADPERLPRRLHADAAGRSRSPTRRRSPASWASTRSTCRRRRTCAARDPDYHERALAYLRACGARRGCAARRRCA